VPTDHCDVAVVGGGLVGLSLAYELACRGASVIVIDAGFAGRATDAGAGILSPDTQHAAEPSGGR
jgi:D-amino-acid dehydrogenase